LGKQYVTDHSLSLFGDTEVDVFIRNLEILFQAGFQKVSDELSQRDDEELAAITATFDAAVANVSAYSKAVRQLVSRYQSQIERIQKGGGSLIDPQGRAYWIRWPDGRRGLALLSQRVDIMGPRRGEYNLLTGISDELRDMALQRTTALFGNVETVKREQVFGMPAGF
jgi:hypothetical protein